MSEPRDDELARLYRESRTAEPSAQVDDAILAAARRAVGAGPRRIGGLRRWAPSLALAASVVLAVALSLNVSEQRPDLANVEAPPPPQTPSAVPPTTPRASTPEGQRLREESARLERPAKPARDAAAPAAVPAEPTGELARRRDENLAAGAAKREFAPAPPAQRPEAAADEARPAQAPAPLEKSVQPPTAPAAAAAPRAAPEMSRPAPEPPRAASAPAAPAADGAGLRSQSRPLASAGARASVFSEATRRAPDEWIAAIRKLKADGKNADVERELEAFRREHPGFRLPEDLTRP
jgi:hypothetical protein